MAVKKENKKRRMKTSSAKAKGRRLQQYVCECISRVIGEPWGYEDDKLIQPRPMGQPGVDIILRGNASALFPFSVECKNAEAVNIFKAAKQAESNAKEGTTWALVVKKNKEEAMWVMPAYVFFAWFDSFLDLIDTLADHALAGDREKSEETLKAIRGKVVKIDKGKLC